MKQDTQGDTADPAPPTDTSANADANAPAPVVAVDVAPNAAMASIVQAAVNVVANVANVANAGMQDSAMPAISAPAIAPSKATGPRAKPATRDASPGPSPGPADAHTKSNATTGEDDHAAPDARSHHRVQPTTARTPAIDSSATDASASSTAKTPDASPRTPDPIADTTLAMPRMAPVVEAAARSGDSRLALEGTDDRQRAVTSALNQMTVRHGAQGRIEVPELGTVHVEARQVAGAIAIDVRTERADAAQTLQHAHGSLISSVREGDMPVWKVDVAHDASRFESRAGSGERHTRDEARDERTKSDDDALTPAPRKTRARFVL